MHDEDGGKVTRLEETRRIGRILRMVQLIAAQPQAWTRARLAAEFEMSERMIDNDLQLIRHALSYEMLRTRSGYYFVESPLVKPVHLTLPETLALALSAQEARQTGTVDAATVAGALARLEGALPPGIVPYLRRADAAMGQQIIGPTRDRGATLAMLERAQVEGRKVRMTYATASRAGAVR